MAAARRTGLHDEAARTMTFPTVASVWQWWNEFCTVIWTAQKWSGFAVTVNGRPMIPYSNQIFYAMKSMKYCFASNLYGGEQDWCGRQCFGCLRLGSVQRYLSDMTDSVWYRHGTFESESAWRVNKALILRQLTVEAEMSLVAFCPAFNMERIRSEVDALLDRIDISCDWEVEYRLDMTDTSVVKVPCGIRYVFPGEDDQEPPTMHQKPQGGLALNFTPGDGSDIKDVDAYLDELLKRKKRGG